MAGGGDGDVGVGWGISWLVAVSIVSKVSGIGELE